MVLASSTHSGWHMVWQGRERIISSSGSGSCTECWPVTPANSSEAVSTESTADHHCCLVVPTLSLVTPVLHSLYIIVYTQIKFASTTVLCAPYSSSYGSSSTNNWSCFLLQFKVLSVVREFIIKLIINVITFNVFF